MHGKSAALEIVQRESSVVVWADSKGQDQFLSGGSAKGLAQKLVDQLRKDYQKRK